MVPNGSTRTYGQVWESEKSPPTPPPNRVALREPLNPLALAYSIQRQPPHSALTLDLFS
jgi:hypothetical protein